MTAPFPISAQNGDIAPRSFEQFARTELMLGRDALERLRRSCVLVAGLGAVGSYAVEALARSGVGRFRLVDFDVVQPSNINRQLFATWETVGRFKADVAKERIAAINPAAQVETRQVLINDKTLPTLFADDWTSPPDFVVDAIDSLGPKVALIAEVTRRGLPLISSMGAALRFDASLVRVGRLTDVSHCPLSAQVRKRLRRVEIDADVVRCVYSPEPIRDRMRAATSGSDGLERVAPAAPLDASNVDSPPGRPRNSLGSLSTIVGIFGLTLAHEVIAGLTDGFGALPR
ncbi:MAG: tRNA threonylcarbamoyladenosine dehydratase [Thermoguttaceae bacterium]|nr:tRNA threonylcarbamoyladenosine dehydratase [Thermoguttaceae bacterium]